MFTSVLPHKNLRMASTSFPPAKRQKRPSIWLDALPLDICVRIASYLPRTARSAEEADGRLPDALSLAAVSYFQAAVIARRKDLSIEHVIDATHTTTLIRQWRNILREIRSVRLPMDVAQNDDVQSLLSLPSIEHIAIPNYPSLLRPLQFLTSLRSLELLITTYCPQNGERGVATSIPTVLKSCPIEELKILCQGCHEYTGYPCLAGTILRPLRYGRRCSTLRSLSVKSTCHQLKHVAKVPAMFPNLTDFKIEHWHFFDHCAKPVFTRLTDDILPFLKMVKSLTMLNCGSVKTFVPGLATNMIGFSSIIPASSADLVSLETYVNLRSLDLVVEKGAEMWFPKNLRNLRSVSLTWETKHRLSLDKKYYHPPGVTIFSILNRNRDIEELRLTNVAIDPSLLEDILTSVGKKLKVLRIPILHQGELPVDRLTRLARLLIRHNENITDLEVCSAYFGTSANLPILYHHENGTCDPRGCELCALWRTAYLLHGLFNRRFRNFRDDGIRRLLFNLQPWR